MRVHVLHVHAPHCLFLFKAATFATLYPPRRSLFKDVVSHRGDVRSFKMFTDTTAWEGAFHGATASRGTRPEARLTGESREDGVKKEGSTEGRGDRLFTRCSLASRRSRQRMLGRMPPL